MCTVLLPPGVKHNYSQQIHHIALYRIYRRYMFQSANLVVTRFGASFKKFFLGVWVIMDNSCLLNIKISTFFIHLIMSY